MFGSSTEEVEWWESGEVGVKDLVVKEDKCLEIKRIKVGFLEYIIRVSDFQYVKMEAGEDLIKTTDGAGVVISFYS